MSPKENLFISSIKKDVGSPHPIEEMKNKLVNIMESLVSVMRRAQKSKLKSLILICSILKRIMPLGRCMTLFMLKTDLLF